MMKEDWTPIDFGQTEDTTKNIIKVIGVGGGGCNAVKNMYAEGIVNVSFAVCNTDSQSLSKSPVPVKIMLGKSGLGAGANPEVGRSEAQNTQEDIKKLLDDGTKMVLLPEWVVERVRVPHLSLPVLPKGWASLPLASSPYLSTSRSERKLSRLCRV